MTEPKEEKCEACCGSGYINFWTDDGHISMRTCRRCDGYGYIKVKPMTNEEWFCQLPTEEKAKWITKNLSVYADDWVKSDEKLLNPATWVEWLKEKHNG